MPRTREEAEALARRLKIPDAEMEEFVADQTGGPPAKVEEVAVAKEPSVKVQVEEKPPAKVETPTAPKATTKPKPKYAALAGDAPVKAPPPVAPPKPTTKYAALAEPTIGNAPTFQRSMPEGSPVGRAVRAVGDVVNRVEVRAPDVKVVEGGYYDVVAPSVRIAQPPPKPVGMADVHRDDAALYRGEVHATAPTPPGTFRADYDYLVGQGYPQSLLDATLADPKKGPAYLMEFAKAKREGKL